MEWLSECLEYGDMLALLEQSREENMCQIRQLSDYFTRLFSKFEQFISESSEMSLDVPSPEKRKHAGSFRVFTEAFTRERSKTTIVKGTEEDAQRISKFENAHLCQIASFRSAFKEFAATILPFLKDFLREYNGKMSDVIGKMRKAMESLGKSRSRFDASYKRYQRAAEELKVAWDRQNPNVAEMKQAFVAAQTNTVETHTHMNEVTAQTAMLMESGLTQYEETEAWRSEKLKGFMVQVGEWMENFAHQIEDGNLVFMQLQRLVPKPESLGPIMDCSQLVPPASDDRFQLVKIDPRATMVLGPEDLFVPEQRRGYVLYKAMADIEGHGDYLAVAKDEVIVCLEQKGAHIIAVNINESKGLVPLSFIARL